MAYGRRNVLYYFEDDDVDACFSRVSGRVDLIHPIVKQAWPNGCSVSTIRTGTPEIGEPIAANR